MPDGVSTNAGASKSPAPAHKPFGPEDESALRESLKRCSPSTFEAAVQFRKTGNAEHVPAVVIGVIERFVEPDLRVKLNAAALAATRNHDAAIVRPAFQDVLRKAADSSRR